MKRLALTLAFLLPGHALAEVKAMLTMNCFPRPVAMAALDELGFHLAAGGLAASGHLVEIFERPGGFMLTFTGPDGGLTCYGAAGEAWQEFPSRDPARAPVRGPRL